MRFPRTTLSCVILLTVIFVWSYFALANFASTDVEKYRELVKNSDPKQLNESSQNYVSTQQHHSTHKDIWFTQRGQRLQLRLRSKDTQLVLEHQDNKTQVVEHMHGVTCFIQEELYYVLPDKREVVRQVDGTFRLRGKSTDDAESLVAVGNATLKPMQTMRYLEADNASYFYQSDRFLAEQVKVSRIVAPGHDLKESLKGFKTIMTGLARSVEFSIVGNELNFTAYQLNATLHGNGGKLR